MRTFLKYISCIVIIILMTSCSLENNSRSVEMYTMYGEVSDITDTCVTINLGKLEKSDPSLFKDKNGSVSIRYSGEEYQIDKELLGQYVDTPLNNGDILQLWYITDEEGTYMVSMSIVSYETMNRDITKSPMDKNNAGQ